MNVNTLSWFILFEFFLPTRQLRWIQWLIQIIDCMFSLNQTSKRKRFSSRKVQRVRKEYCQIWKKVKGCTRIHTHLHTWRLHGVLFERYIFWKLSIFGILISPEDRKLNHKMRPKINLKLPQYEDFWKWILLTFMIEGQEIFG